MVQEMGCQVPHRDYYQGYKNNFLGSYLDKLIKVRILCSSEAIYNVGAKFILMNQATTEMPKSERKIKTKKFFKNKRGGITV